MVVVCVVVEGVGGVICFLNFTDPGLSYKLSYQGPISLTDLNLFWGLNVTQSDSWLSLSLFVKSAPGVTEVRTQHIWCDSTHFPCYQGSVVMAEGILKLPGSYFSQNSHNEIIHANTIQLLKIRRTFFKLQ